MTALGRQKNKVLTCMLLSQLCAMTAISAAASGQPVKFEIAAGNAVDALGQFSRQSGLQMLFLTQTVQ